MIPRILLGTALIPDTDKEMQLYQSGDLFSIKIPGRGDLMNSRVHGSEKALADLAQFCASRLVELLFVAYDDAIERCRFYQQ